MSPRNAGDAIPSLLYTDVEDELRATLRAMLAERCPWTAVLARIDAGTGHDDALWKSVAGELGLAGLLVPERLGGAGAGAREAAVVMEELGRAVAPVPFLASAVLATGALLAAGTDAAEDVVRTLASGEATGALVVTATAWPQAPFPGRVAADGGVLTGRVTNVLSAGAASVLVVPATSDGAPCLVTLAADAPGVLVEESVSLDATRPVATVAFDAAAGTVIATGTEAVEALRRALTLGAGLLASEQLGLADQALETTVEYLKVRHQFGRPIGSFQALRHRAADLWADVATARATARYAAACLADDAADSPVAAALAAVYCGDVAVHTAEECVQMHGGIGFTWEHPAHLYLKRAMSDALLLGTGDRHRQALAGLVDLPS